MPVVTVCRLHPAREVKHGPAQPAFGEKISIGDSLRLQYALADAHGNVFRLLPICM